MLNSNNFFTQNQNKQALFVDNYLESLLTITLCNSYSLGG